MSVYIPPVDFQKMSQRSMPEGVKKFLVIERGIELNSDENKLLKYLANFNNDQVRADQVLKAREVLRGGIRAVRNFHVSTGLNVPDADTFVKESMPLSFSMLYTMDSILDYYKVPYAQGVGQIGPWLWNAAKSAWGGLPAAARWLAGGGLAYGGYKVLGAAYDFLGGSKGEMTDRIIAAELELSELKTSGADPDDIASAEASLEALKSTYSKYYAGPLEGISGTQVLIVGSVIYLIYQLGQGTGGAGAQIGKIGKGFADVINKLTKGETRGGRKQKEDIAMPILRIAIWGGGAYWLFSKLGSKAKE